MYISEIEIDADNEAHLTRHGVTIAEVVQVFANRPEIRRNRRDRTATHIARGTTFDGRWLVVPFISRGPGKARPLTAW